MEVTVLGSGAAYPRPGGACSGFLVRGQQAAVWIDAGNGTLSNLQLHQSYRDVDALVLSHVHGDHIADVIPLMYARGFDESVEGRLPVFSPPEVPDVLWEPLGDMSRDLFTQTFAFDTLDRTLEVGGLRVEPFRTVHPVETYGMRVSDGHRTFVYTADTAEFAELASSCRGADLLLCEATFVRPMQAADGIHLWADQSGALAQRADAGRLVLTHVWPTVPLEQAVAEASDAFTGPVEAAVEGATYTV